MAWVFNPFTGTLDQTGSGGGTPGGSDTQIQFNDGGTTFGGDADLTWNKTTNVMTVTGDVNLSDGGTYTTTLQTITPTANRTVSIPDATGTLALVAGSSGQPVYNNAGAYAGLNTATIGTTGNITLSLNGAASTPPVSFTGTWFTGGTGTTTKPQLLIEPTGTTSTAWSTSGTGFGVNAASGFAGRLLDLQVNGTSFFKVKNNGDFSVYNTALVADANNTFGVFHVSGGYHLSDSSNTQPFIKVGGGGTGSIQLRSDSGYLGWGAEGQAGGTPTLVIARDAANTLAQRNGTSAQVFRVYNTYTSSTNYELGKLEWTSNVFRIGTEKGSGGGTARDLEFQTDGTTRLTVAATTGAVTATGNISASTVYATGVSTGFVGNRLFLDSANQDVVLNRDAAGTLAQRNSTNAQTFRCYGTYTDASNYVRAALSSSSTAVTLAAETAGTGADNVPINLTAAGTGTVKVNSVAEVAVSSTVAGLPAAPAVGMLTRVTDATAPAVGSTVAGSGAAAALVWYNGTNWTVIGV